MKFSKTSIYILLAFIFFLIIFWNFQATHNLNSSILLAVVLFGVPISYILFWKYLNKRLLAVQDISNYQSGRFKFLAFAELILGLFWLIYTALPVPFAGTIASGIGREIANKWLYLIGLELVTLALIVASAKVYIYRIFKFSRAFLKFRMYLYLAIALFFLIEFIIAITGQGKLFPGLI